ncbi:acetyl-CoA C-acyltransferase [Micromonospora sp. M12]
MPETAENVAAEYGVSRAEQDAFAYRSQQRAAKAQADGRFAEEIVAVSVPAGRRETRLVEVDEHPGDHACEVGRAAHPFRDGGTVTAGNSSGINDGAVALLVASEAAVERYGLTRWPGSSVRRRPVCRRIMGIGPVPATRKLLDRVGVEMGAVDVVELNEAFAAQSVAVLRELGLPVDADHVNPNGGAIALGHPLGASGARLALTAALELRRRGGRRALATMCIGVGQGISLLLESAA